MLRSASATVLDDGTDLAGAEVDVAVRCAWTLRMARVLSGRHPRLEDMAAATRSNPTRLHRLETAKLRDGALVEAYERALDLPPGLLRAPIDILCRTFPAHSPREKNGASPVRTVGGLSELTMALLEPAGTAGAADSADRAVAAHRVDLAGPALRGAALERARRSGCEPASAPPTGGDWLTWARALAQPGAIGLPEPFAATLVGRLIEELTGACGHGYPSRYEALSLLRCSEYGHLVLEGAQRLVAVHEGQAINDVMSAVGEAVTPQAVSWCLALLRDPRDQILVAAAIALENMGQVSRDAAAFWAPLVDPLVSALDESVTDSVRHHWLSHLLRLVPAATLARAADGRVRVLVPAARVPDWSRSRVNAHWAASEARALQIADELGLPEQPLLARLVFDISVSPYESKAVTSAMLLGALPAVSRRVGEHLVALAGAHEDPVIRERAARRLACVTGSACRCTA